MVPASILRGLRFRFGPDLTLDAYTRQHSHTVPLDSSRSIAAANGGNRCRNGSRLRPNPSGNGQSVSAGVAIFGLRQNGILISEAAVPAAVPATSGRIYDGRQFVNYGFGVDSIFATSPGFRRSTFI
jgi:hypothetical protein